MSTVGWHLLSQTLFSFIIFLPQNLLYGAARIANFEGILGFFCSVNHFSEGGVKANHNVTCSPSLAENDSRLLKNSEENPDGEWSFCRRK